MSAAEGDAFCLFVNVAGWGLPVVAYVYFVYVVRCGWRVLSFCLCQLWRLGWWWGTVYLPMLLVEVDEFCLFIYAVDVQQLSWFLVQCSWRCDCFYIAIFSGLEQTYCDLVAYHSDWMNEWLPVAFYSAFFNIHSRGVLTALFGCCTAGGTWNWILLC